MDERVLDRWMSLELGNLHRGLVTAPRPLWEVALEEAPLARTRGGDEHRFDRDAVARLHAKLPPLLRRRVRVPLSFYVDREADGSCSTEDRATIEALETLGRLPSGTAARGGRAWMSLPLALDFLRDYPTLGQLVPL